jgi:glycosyltransferase involved in cell wall biosynthesis
MRILVVVPALNEEQALGPLIAGLRALFSASRGDTALSGQIVVIDDGSSDDTAAVAAASGARVVRLCHNLGIGGAVQSGLRLALREDFDCAIQVDGDGQHPPGEIVKLLAALRSSPPPDLVIGTRFAADAEAGFRSTLLRRIGSRWLRLLLRLVTGLGLTDPTSGYRLYGRRALQLFSRSYPYDYPEPEALATARAAGLRIVEVPVRMRERQAGRSSISGLSAPYYMLKVTLAVVLSYLRASRRQRPALMRGLESD